MYKSLFWAALAATLAAQTAKPDPISSFNWIIGQWQCKGVTPAGKIDYTFAQ